ncbi:YdcF family protein [Clostridium sp. 'deep sea']|uniref:YdcF family protein n=1 Tax=Clostridium sp. 'deep sea' TaxID=2779445 RepID=UPI0018967AD2|nr:YdcF family protein [Clostridium sp. 'deep sea']QOR35179.1 YdcF family protein [Clostridium sp. 'deep sea']
MRKGYDCITEFIFMEDQIEKADVILVPGGSHKQLSQKAAELYNKGYAKYILFSGGHNKHLPDNMSEFEFLKDEAVRSGVPEDAILKEDKASHTFENAKFSLEVLKKHNIIAQKAILVCKNLHARRAYLSYKMYFPKDVKFIVQPIIDGKEIRKNNWFLFQDKTSRVMSEVVKIGKYFEEHMSKLI